MQRHDYSNFTNTPIDLKVGKGVTLGCQENKKDCFIAGVPNLFNEINVQPGIQWIDNTVQPGIQWIDNTVQPGIQWIDNAVQPGIQWIDNTNCDKIAQNENRK